MMLMKQRVLGTTLIWIILLFSAPAIALATGFQGQGGLFSTQQQQQQTTTPSGQSSSQQPDQVDGSSTLDQNLSITDTTALPPPQQQLTGQTRLQLEDEQTTPRTDRPVNRNQPERPVQLSEFQRLVAASIGKVLPIYGANLFRNVPSTFAPVTRIPVTPDYVIGPGDELLIRIWGQVILDGHFTVDRSGAIYIPRVGTIQVSGIPIAKLTDYLRSQVGRNFKNFDLNVNMGQLRSIDIFVVGEARRPGSYTVSSLSTLVNALFASGGPTPAGSMRNIQVRRGKETIATFDLYDLLLRGDKSKDVPLLSGDVVYIPPVGPMVALAGSIDTPALYELKSESNTKEVLALAGGLTTLARHKEVRLERIRRRDDSRSVLDINLDADGLATALVDGDILEISPIIDRFKDAVTLRGNVADPRRFTWVPGMRVRDLIPDKEALLTRDYWQQRNQLGLPVLESNPDVRRYAPDEPVAQVNGVGISPARSTQMVIAPNARDSDSNIYGNNLSNPILGQGALRDAPHDANSSTSSTSQGIDTAATPTNSNSNGTDNTRSSRSSGLNSNSVLASQDNASSSAAGTSISSAVTATAQRFPVKNSVVLPAPEVDWAYAVIQRLNKKDLTTQLLPFNLGRAVIDGDPTQNLELEPGDVITVFSKADIRVPQSQQTKFVHLQGEFVAAGIYSVAPGETLRQLVARAGGLTKDAYLYGSQFTRESTKVIQQRRLLEYADDLDRRIKLAEANAANTTLNPQDQLADIAALQNARTVSARLRELNSNGRIVLNMAPDSSTLNDIPDLPLEDGDAFVIPQRPLSVDVYGSVYTQSSFLFDPHKRAQDYIRQAGGGTRTADIKRSYIFHADGSIVSRQYSTALFSSNFEAQRLHPGDAVVVPEQVDKRPMLRNLVDIATIVGQFGLGIAAINVL